MPRKPDVDRRPKTGPTHRLHARYLSRKQRKTGKERILREAEGATWYDGAKIYIAGKPKVRRSPFDWFSKGSRGLAIIPSGSWVSAHYHDYGVERYRFVHGDGKMFLGRPLEGGKIEWGKPIYVREGEYFVIPKGMAHSFEPTGKGPAVLEFYGSPPWDPKKNVAVDDPPHLRGKNKPEGKGSEFHWGDWE
ncbi:MAG: hypothetical protein JXB14_08235 [Candidatus Altiarchaeota archaeon]|nr:hypothetical protein [Candidatus Altiarchaeota archaeon]